MDRRTFLTGAGGLTAAATLAPALLREGAAAARLPSGAFRHGVASGDPLGDRVVLWTRVTPGPHAFPGSGQGPNTTVTWQVARDPQFSRVVRSGRVVTGATRDHTVKVDAAGLQPGSRYWYRFRALGETSPVGRTRTATAGCPDVDSLRFGLVSCANYEGGFFRGYGHLAERDDLDFVLHLGDYIYEYGTGEYGPGPEIDRTHQPAHEIVSLADYRRRHAQYKTDPDLAALHRRNPFIITLDDHEVANDSHRAGAENHTPETEGDYRDRRARAMRAMLEWQPIRPPSPGRLYRRLPQGDLADIHLLDLRRYRDPQVATPTDPAIDDPTRTITGDAQMGWLKNGLSRNGITWRFVANPVMIAPVDVPGLDGLPPGTADALAQLTNSSAPVQGGAPYNVDQWDGYRADRAELLGHLDDQGIDNVVFLTGDIHSSWACDLPLDPATYPASGSVATELVGTSITSDNLDDITGSEPRTTSIAVEEAIKTANPHIKLLEFDSHGYSVVDVDADRVQMDWYYLSDRTDPEATVSFAQAWAVQAGANAVAPAAGALPARDGALVGCA